MFPYTSSYRAPGKASNGSEQKLRFTEETIVFSSQVCYLSDYLRDKRCITAR